MVISPWYSGLIYSIDTGADRSDYRRDMYFLTIATRIIITNNKVHIGKRLVGARAMHGYESWRMRGSNRKEYHVIPEGTPSNTLAPGHRLGQPLLVATISIHTHLTYDVCPLKLTREAPPVITSLTCNITDNSSPTTVLHHHSPAHCNASTPKGSRYVCITKSRPG